MSLYLVTVVVDMLVEAEGLHQARNIAIKNVGSEVDNADTESEIEIKSMKDLPKEWAGCLPYGGDGKRSIDEILGNL